MTPSSATIRRVIKPALFVICALPLLGLIWAFLGTEYRIGSGSLGANPVEKIQDTFGQWGLRFILITLAVTPLRDWFNMPWLVQLRRMVGLYAFFYVLMHFLTWLILDQGLYWSGIVQDIGERPFITIGFAALLMLVPLAVTSTNKMMRRLGRRWKKLHRLVYVIGVLGVWHYYWQVKSDVTEPLIYVAIAAVLLGWRVWKARPRRQAVVAPISTHGATQGSTENP